MEVVAFLALLAGGVLAVLLAAKALFWIVAFVILPLFWIWMLVDAIVRKPEDYPSRSMNEKILWIVLMIVFQVSAAVYFFMVHRAAGSRQAVSPADAACGTSYADNDGSGTAGAGSNPAPRGVVGTPGRLTTAVADDPAASAAGSSCVPCRARPHRPMWESSTWVTAHHASHPDPPREGR